MADFNETIFDGKTFGDLLKEIHVKSNKKEKIIHGLINELKPLVTDLGDATLLVPLIASYLDMSIKNDDQLIKLANVVQKHMSKISNQGDNILLSEEEKAQLMNDIKHFK